MATKQLTEQVDLLGSKVTQVLKMCYDALEEDADQGVRDAIRAALKPLVEKAGVEE